MNFQKEVIETSQSIPVLVDFWAAWCGPCRVLGPILDELAAENTDKFKLVKVDTESNQDLAMKYNIRGIPAVKLFYRGEVIQEFVGVQPKKQIEYWLSQSLPDERLEDLELILKVENNSAKIKQLEDFISTNNDLDMPKIELAKIIVLVDPVKAADLVEGILWDSERFDEVEDIRTLSRLMTEEKNGNEKIDGLLENARIALKSGNYDNALNELVAAVGVDKHYKEDLPRLASIAIFHILGESNEISKKHRKAFDMALY